MIDVASNILLCQNFYQIDELEGQKRLRTEMVQVEDSLAQTRKEYDMLRIEFEQAMAANDQNCKSSKCLLSFFILFL